MKASLTKIAYAVAFLAVIGYALVTLRGPHGIAALIQKRHQIQEMEDHNYRLTRENERQRDHIRRLVDNPAEQELEIRERLKLVNPKDKVYIIGEPEKK